MKDRKYSYLLSILLCLLLVPVLTGCFTAAKTKTGSNTPQIVEVWHYYNGAQKSSFDDMVQEFNDSVGMEQGIVIEAVSKGSVGEMNQALSDSAEKKVGADPLPQITAAYANIAYSLAQQGLLADMNPYLTAGEQALYVDAYIEEGHFDTDALWLFPTAKSTEMLTVNMTDWEAFAAETGADIGDFQTWEGIVSLAQRYYDWSDGKAMFGRDAFANYMLVGSYQLGHDIFTVQDGKMILDFDQQSIKRLWDCYYTPYISGYFAAGGKFRSDDMKTGNVIAYVGSSASVTYTPASVTFENGSSYDITCRLFPLPNFAGTTPCAVQQGAGMTVLKSNQETEAAAVMFLQWFTEPERNLEFCIQAGYLPVTKEANNEAALEKVLLERQLEVSEIMKQGLLVGVDEVTDYQLYSGKPFEKGMEARTVLDTAMPQKAEQDKAAIDELVAGGMDRQEAIALYDTEENFTQWYQETYQKLKTLGE